MLEVLVALYAPFLVLRVEKTGSAVCRRCCECDGRYSAKRGRPTLYYLLSFPMGYQDFRPWAPQVVLIAYFLSSGSMLTGVLLMALSCGGGLGCPVISADKSCLRVFRGCSSKKKTDHRHVRPPAGGTRRLSVCREMVSYARRMNPGNVGSWGLRSSTNCRPISTMVDQSVKIFENCGEGEGHVIRPRTRTGSGAERGGWQCSPKTPRECGLLRQ